MRWSVELLEENEWFTLERIIDREAERTRRSAVFMIPKIRSYSMTPESLEGEIQTQEQILRNPFSKLKFNKSKLK